MFTAERAVDIAAAAMIRGRSHIRALVDKGDYGFATVIDVEIERLVRAHLGKETPGIPVLGEEEGGGALESEAVWVLDPIDGTANYADGSPLCSISLALVRDGQPVLGIVAAPLLGERFVAVEGAERTATAAGSASLRRSSVTRWSHCPTSPSATSTARLTGSASRSSRSSWRVR